MTKDQLVDTTVKAINAYCRVLELHMQGIAQGMSPIVDVRTAGGQVIRDAQEGLVREVKFLRFLRESDETDGQR